MGCRIERLLLLLALLLLGLTPAIADERLFVVMDGAAGVDELTAEQVINIFLGRFRQLANGQTATPIDQPQDEALLGDFYRLLVDKKPAEIRSYWSRLVFSGKTAPPQQAQSREHAIAWVRNTPGAIAYLRAADCPPQLKVVFILEP